MSKYKVDIAGINTNSLPVLKNDEMIILFKKLRNGDKLAKETIVNGNLKLVLSLVQKYNNGKCDMNDLFQIGCVGLIKAVDNFDLTFNVQFSTYAVPLILGEIRRYIRGLTDVRIARSIKDTAYKILKYKDEYLLKYGKEATNDEICKALELTEYNLGSALNSLKPTMSIYEPIYNDGGDTIYLVDQLEDKKDNIYPIEYKIALKEALKELKQKEKYIIYERYIMGKTQLELAEEIGISQAQISRLEKSGIEYIKKKIK